MKLENSNAARFVVATPSRSVCDDNARVLDSHGMLRLYCLGTRRGTKGIPEDKTRLWPWFGLLNTASAKLFGSWKAEPFRFRLYPFFDRWVLQQLQAGDHIISSYGYANECFKWVRNHGGKTFLDGGNSHPDNFWTILQEEHRRWKCPRPPVSRFHHERSLAMMEDVDYVLSPSSYVTRSFLERGFRPEQIIPNVYPIDLACFSPKPSFSNSKPKTQNPKHSPLTLINTGSLSLRKGTPYLLEAYRQIRKTIPDARLLLTDSISECVKPVLARYANLPIEWSPSLPHAKLAERLRSADIFLLPSLEDGFARTVTEALSCGLPAITTSNTGASDLVRDGVNGSIVPLRDPEALVQAVLFWQEKLRSDSWQARPLVDGHLLDFTHFEKTLLPYFQKIIVS